MLKPTNGIMTNLTVHAKATDTEVTDIAAKHLFACKNTWQNHVEDRARTVHDAARQSHDRNPPALPLEIPQQEHRARQYRCAIGLDLRPRITDGSRRPVIRIDTHAA